MLIHLALSGDIFTSPYGVKVLLASGANPHLLSKEAVPCNPTQVALKHADVFWMWRQALRESGHDLTQFVHVSSKQPCWDNSGWSEHKLQQVFEIKFPWLLRLVYQNSFQCWLCGGGWFAPRCHWWETVIQQVQSGDIDQFLSFSEFLEVPEAPESFALAVQKMLHMPPEAARPSFSDRERIIYRSLWRAYWDVLSTCAICTSRVRKVALQNAISESSSSDSLKALRGAIQPGLEASQLLRRRWDTFKARLEDNWSRCGPELKQG